jgi:two-component system, chemotaxis family, protein-glutamate methylesterase/glutaminase
MTQQRGYELVTIGTSWGGLDVLRVVLGDLPAGFGAAIVVAQHRSAESHPTALLDLLRAVTPLHVYEADDKDELRPGLVYVAAPDYHLMVEDGIVALTTEAPVQYARPSIDVLFESAAEAYRERLVGVILTGANDDGAQGLACIVELGGTAIVQDPESAARAEMPRAALAAVPGARVAAVEEIAPLLVELCGREVAA